MDAKVESSAETSDGQAGASPVQPITYAHTPNFPDLLRSLRLSLLVTTYQARRLMVIGPGGDSRLRLQAREFDKVTGLAVHGKRAALCARNQVWLLRHADDLCDPDGKPLPYDYYLVPRQSFITGDIAAHEAAFVGADLAVINTRFSCLCSLSPDWSFTVRWKPAFVTRIAPEDRCHLNGMAVDESGIRCLTAVAKSDTPAGWREHKRDGGIIIDFTSSEIITADLSMPHSPRFHAGRLWVLDSGRGELKMIDQGTGKHVTVTVLPGFLRGLAFFDRFAFVGLSQIRESGTFGNLLLEERFKDLQCGIYCVDLASGSVAAFIRFTGPITELFDVQVLPGVLNPYILGTKDEHINNVFLIPPG